MEKVPHYNILYFLRYKHPGIYELFTHTETTENVKNQSTFKEKYKVRR